ncbi:unnamed protein product [Brassica rapa subsp. trilocularis]|uniref:Uncharacterized protein n=1 Tax=Brassica campestris TaxID=3711 RepID=M4E8P9_BRACM
MMSELQSKIESLLDKRCILEALRILRTWVEDEAKSGQGRAKVLEEAGDKDGNGIDHS